MEKKVMVRLCAKIVADTDLYETDKEVQNLIDWVCLSEQIKENNNTIRNLIVEYNKIEPDCRKGVRTQLERMKELCKERNNLYEKQNDTIDRLQEKASDLGRLERHFGREQVQSIVERSKAIEQAERAIKRPKRAFELSR